MRFRNSFILFMHNFRSTYVLLLFRAITTLVTGALAMVIVNSGFGFLNGSEPLQQVTDSLLEVLATFFNSADFTEFDLLFREALDEVIASLGELLIFLNNHLTEIVLSGLGLVVLYLLNRFLNGLAIFAFGDILNDKMSQYAETPFFVGFFSNIGTAALYQVVYVPLAFVFDVASLVICYFLFFRLFVFLPVLIDLMLGVTFLIAMQAVKLAIISDWMPAVITDGKKLSVAIKESFRLGRKQFAISFSNYLMACYCIVVVNVLCAVATIGSALLITIPASFAFLICLQFVNYYTARNKRFFLSFTNICDTNNPDGGGSFVNGTETAGEASEVPEEALPVPEAHATETADGDEAQEPSAMSNMSEMSNMTEKSNMSEMSEAQTARNGDAEQ